MPRACVRVWGIYSAPLQPSPCLPPPLQQLRPVRVALAWGPLPRLLLCEGATASMAVSARLRRLRPKPGCGRCCCCAHSERRQCYRVAVLAGSMQLLRFPRLELRAPVPPVVPLRVCRHHDAGRRARSLRFLMPTYLFGV